MWTSLVTWPSRSPSSRRGLGRGFEVDDCHDLAIFRVFFVALLLLFLLALGEWNLFASAFCKPTSSSFFRIRSWLDIPPFPAPMRDRDVFVPSLPFIIPRDQFVLHIVIDLSPWHLSRAPELPRPSTVGNLPDPALPPAPPLTHGLSLAGSGLRVAIVHARWNATIIDQLVAGAKKNLLAAGVTEDNITVQTVPGSYELPLGVQR